VNNKERFAVRGAMLLIISASVFAACNHDNGISVLNLVPLKSGTSEITQAAVSSAGSALPVQLQSSSSSAANIPPKIKYNAGESPEYAKNMGWPVKTPPPLNGSILPGKRIVAYYGNPLSRKMGVLGEFPKDEMLARLKGEIAKWEDADPSLPVQPALHLIAVVAQGSPGKSGKYRMVVPDADVAKVYEWAKRDGGRSCL